MTYHTYKSMGKLSRDAQEALYKVWRRDAERIEAGHKPIVQFDLNRMIGLVMGPAYMLAFEARRAAETAMNLARGVPSGPAPPTAPAAPMAPAPPKASTPPQTADGNAASEQGGEEEKKKKSKKRDKSRSRDPSRSRPASPSGEVAKPKKKSRKKQDSDDDVSCSSRLET